MEGKRILGGNLSWGMALAVNHYAYAFNKIVNDGKILSSDMLGRLLLILSFVIFPRFATEASSGVLL